MAQSAFLIYQARDELREDGIFLDGPQPSNVLLGISVKGGNVLRDASDNPFHDDWTRSRRTKLSAERSSELSAVLKRSRWTIALINGVMLGLIVCGSAAYYFLTDAIHYGAALVFTLWSVLVQIMMRRTMTQRERRRQMRELKGLLIEAALILFTIWLFFWPIYTRFIAPWY